MEKKKAELKVNTFPLNWEILRQGCSLAVLFNIVLQGPASAGI